MYHQLFFGATCAGILMAAGLMPLPDRSNLPEVSVSVADFDISEISLPDRAEVIAGIEEMVEDLPEMRADFNENVVRPSVERLAAAFAPSEKRAEPAQPAVIETPEVEVASADIPTPEARPDMPRGMAKTVNFDLDTAELDAAAKAQLDRFVQQLTEDPTARLGIFGHTDLTGDDTYNDFLGQVRAERVADYLTGKGIARERIEIIKSYGERAPNVATDAASRDNRRVDIEVM